MRNLNQSLNNSWNNHDLFNYFLNFNHFGYLNQLIDNLFYSASNFFYSLDCSWNFNYLFNDTVNNLNIFDVLDIRFLDLDDLGFFNNFFFNTFDWHHMWYMDSFNNNHWNLSGYCHYFLLNHRNLNDSINLFDHLNCPLVDVVDYFLNLNYFNNFNYLVNT